MTRYRVVCAIDLFLLWNRLGGAYAIFGAIATLIFSKTGSPPWLGWIVGLAAAGMAVLGVVRVLLAVKVWQRGVAVTGRVVEVEKRRNRGSEHVSLKTRVRFTVHLDGHGHTGVSTWGGPSRTALLAVGGPIELRYDPDRPGSVFWDEDPPIRMPPLAFS